MSLRPALAVVSLPRISACKTDTMVSPDAATGLRALLAASLLGLTVAMPAHASGAMVKRQDEVYDEYDFVVVGAGTAGLTVADRLSEEGKCKSSNQTGKYRAPPGA